MSSFMVKTENPACPGYMRSTMKVHRNVLTEQWDKLLALLDQYQADMVKKDLEICEVEKNLKDQVQKLNNKTNYEAELIRLKKKLKEKDDALLEAQAEVLKVKENLKNSDSDCEAVLHANSELEKELTLVKARLQRETSRLHETEARVSERENQNDILCEKYSAVSDQLHDSEVRNSEMTQKIAQIRSMFQNERAKLKSQLEDAKMQVDVLVEELAKTSAPCTFTRKGKHLQSELNESECDKRVEKSNFSDVSIDLQEESFSLDLVDSAQGDPDSSSFVMLKEQGTSGDAEGKESDHGKIYQKKFDRSTPKKSPASTKGVLSDPAPSSPMQCRILNIFSHASGEVCLNEGSQVHPLESSIVVKEDPDMLQTPSKKDLSSCRDESHGSFSEGRRVFDSKNDLQLQLSNFEDDLEEDDPHFHNPGRADLNSSSAATMGSQSVSPQKEHWKNGDASELRSSIASQNDIKALMRMISAEMKDIARPCTRHSSKVAERQESEGNVCVMAGKSNLFDRRKIDNTLPNHDDIPRRWHSKTQNVGPKYLVCGCSVLLNRSGKTELTLTPTLKQTTSARSDSDEKSDAAPKRRGRPSKSMSPWTGELLPNKLRMKGTKRKSREVSPGGRSLERNSRKKRVRKCFCGCTDEDIDYLLMPELFEGNDEVLGMLSEQDITDSMDSEALQEKLNELTDSEKKAGSDVGEPAKQGKPPKLFKCSKCVEKFTCLSRLRMHSKRAHSKPKKWFKCSECVKKFSCLYHLKMHKRVHSKPKKSFSCIVCSKSFETKSDLGSHLDVHREQDSHQCRKCPKVFFRKEDLVSHEVVCSDSDESVHECRHCSETFPTNVALLAHLKSHRTDRPFKCPKCPKTFPNKIFLFVHERMHSTEEIAPRMDAQHVQSCS